MSPSKTPKKVKRTAKSVTLKPLPPRISKNISGEVKRMDRLFKKIENDPADFQRFLKRPKPFLAEFGIDLEKYASGKVTAKVLEDEILAMSHQVFETGIMVRLGEIIDIANANSYSSSTETSYEYNFDNSSSTDYKYESHTGTERGTFSETSSGTAMDTRTSFAGLTGQAFLDMVRGPLISQIAIKQILAHVENTLTRAARFQMLP